MIEIMFHVQNKQSPLGGPKCEYETRRGFDAGVISEVCEPSGWVITISENCNN